MSRNMVYWTDEEIRILKENYSDNFDSDLVPMLGRSLSSIKDKAWKSHLVKGDVFREKERLRLSSRMLLSNPMRREDIANKCADTLRERYKSGQIINFFKGKKSPHLTKRNLEDNPMKRIESRLKVSRTIREKFASGEIKKWQLGHTKDTHPGLMEISRKSRCREFSDEHKQKIRESHWSRSEKRDKIIERTKHVGEKHPFWLGGKSYEGYGFDFNRKLKNIIKSRDGVCMMCNISIDDCRLLRRQVQVHHINYIKSCNIIQNLVTLCNLCHVKTNFNRNQWTKFFQPLLAERYEYKYSEEGDIILEVKNAE